MSLATRISRVARSLAMKARRTFGPLIIRGSVGDFAARLFGNRLPHRGLRVDVSSKLVSPVTKAAILLRAYESGEIRFMNRYLPRERDVVELGGSLGVMSCLIRRKIAPECRLLVVEADPRIAEILRSNLRLNRCEQGTTVENVAICDGEVESISFALGVRSDSGRLASGRRASEETVTISAMSLKRLLDRHGIESYSLVSDIEGAEWSLWRNQREALLKAEVIILETHDNPEFGSYQDLITEMAGDPAFEIVDRYGPVVVLRNRTK
jgi:FkbM family methyltransferase